MHPNPPGPCRGADKCLGVSLSVGGRCRGRASLAAAALHPRSAFRHRSAGARGQRRVPIAGLVAWGMIASLLGHDLPAGADVGDGTVRAFRAASGALETVRRTLAVWRLTLERGLESDGLQAAIEGSIDVAHGLLLSEARILRANRPGLVDPWAERIDSRGILVPRRAPYLAVDGIGRPAHRQIWRRQAFHNFALADTLVSDDLRQVKQAIGWPWSRADTMGFYRALMLRGALQEVLRVVFLLKSPAVDLTAAPGRTLIREGFDDPSVLGREWERFGPGTMRVVDGALEIRQPHAGNPNTMVWLTRTVGPDLILELDFTPATKGGLILAFNAAPLGPKREDFSASTGPGMDSYNDGFRAYHYSVHRSTGTTHMRRVGPGLWMLSQTSPDPCPDEGKTYHLKVVKRGNASVLVVNGALAHSYVDAETYGPVPGAGRIGIRHFGPPLEARYDNLLVREVRQEGATGEKP